MLVSVLCNQPSCSINDTTGIAERGKENYATVNNAVLIVKMGTPDRRVHDDDNKTFAVMDESCDNIFIFY